MHSAWKKPLNMSKVSSRIMDILCLTHLQEYYNITKMGLSFFPIVNMIFVLQKMVHSAWKKILYKSQVSNLIIDNLS